MANRPGLSMALACMVLVFPLNAAKGDTLEAAVFSAFESHPSIETAKAAMGAAHEEKRAELSAYYPSLSATATGGRIYGDNATSRGLSVTRGAGYSNLWEGTVSARQRIFDGFETQNKVSAAEARERSADMGVLDAREAIALRATQAYLNLMRTQEAVKILKGHKAKVLDYLERIKIAVDNGVVDESEHQLARDVKVILDGFITDYEGQARTAHANYREAVGREPDGDMVSPQPYLEFVPETSEEAIALIKDSHPLIKAAVFQSESAQHDVASEEATIYPDLDGELSYLQNEKDDLIGGETTDARAVLKLSWAFDTGGAQLARIRQRKFQYNQAQSRVRETEMQVSNQIRLAYSDLQTAQDRLAQQKTRLDLNKKLFETYEVQFEGARISLLQLMQADNQLFNTRLEKLNGEYGLLANQYNVLASMGRLQDSLVMASPKTGPAQDEQK